MNKECWSVYIYLFLACIFNIIINHFQYLYFTFKNMYITYFILCVTIKDNNTDVEKCFGFHNPFALFPVPLFLIQMISVLIGLCDMILEDK